MASGNEGIAQCQITETWSLHPDQVERLRPFIFRDQLPGSPVAEAMAQGDNGIGDMIALVLDGGAAHAIKIVGETGSCDEPG